MFLVYILICKYITILKNTQINFSEFAILFMKLAKILYIYNVKLTFYQRWANGVEEMRP